MERYRRALIIGLGALTCSLLILVARTHDRWSSGAIHPTHAQYRSAPASTTVGDIVGSTRLRLLQTLRNARAGTIVGSGGYAQTDAAGSVVRLVPNDGSTPIIFRSRCVGNPTECRFAAKEQRAAMERAVLRLQGVSGAKRAVPSGRQ